MKKKLMNMLKRWRRGYFLSDVKENLTEYFDLAFERHRMYCLKMLGAKKPWTRNHVLKHNFFCNVFRKLDKTSLWIENNVNRPFHNMPDFWKSIIVCRMISWVPTLEELKENACLYGDWEKAQEVLTDRYLRNEKIFTSAFVINAVGYGTKVNYLFSLLKAIENKYPNFDEKIKSDSLNDLHTRLMDFDSVGDFMAYEYVTDFTYTYKKDDSDIYKWAVLGIGAKRGYNRIFNGEPLKNVDKNYLKRCNSIFNTWNKYITKQIHFEIFKTKEDYKLKVKNPVKQGEIFIENTFKKYFYNLTMREVEHWLCEYDKYKRGGNSRKYDGA